MSFRISRLLENLQLILIRIVKVKDRSNVIYHAEHSNHKIIKRNMDR